MVIRVVSKKRGALEGPTYDEDLFIFGAETLKKFILVGVHSSLRRNPEPPSSIIKRLPIFAEALPRTPSTVYRTLPRPFMFPILELPNEVIYDIAEILSGNNHVTFVWTIRDIINFSSTCKRIRIIISPWIFNLLRLPGDFSSHGTRKDFPDWNSFPSQRVKRLIVRGVTSSGNDESTAEQVVTNVTLETFPLLREVEIHLPLGLESLNKIAKHLSSIPSIRLFTLRAIHDNAGYVPFPNRSLHHSLDHIPSLLTGLRLPLLSELDGRICRAISQLQSLDVLSVSPWALVSESSVPHNEDEYEWKTRKLIIGDWEPFAIGKENGPRPHRLTPLGVIFKILRFVASSVEVLIFNGLILDLRHTPSPEWLDPIPFKQLSTIKLQFFKYSLEYRPNFKVSRSIAGKLLRKAFSLAPITRFDDIHSYSRWAIPDRIPYWPSLKFYLRGFEDEKCPGKLVYEYWELDGPSKRTVTKYVTPTYYGYYLKVY